MVDENLGRKGINVIGVMRADRSLGNEALVLTARFDSDTLRYLPPKYLLPD